MRVTELKYFKEYNDRIGKRIDQMISSYDFSESNGNFEYMIQASAVFSSNIEGNTVDLNSYLNYKLAKTKPNREILEIENLEQAYEFARKNRLNEKNALKCHKIFSKTLVSKNRQGKYRNEKVGVFDNSGLVYLAVEPEFLKKIISELYQDIDQLINQDMNNARVFYHASLIHLKFAHIHPFADGNGRAARLMEKWFIAEKIGMDFWKLPSEKYYKENRHEYYKNINLGVNYYELNYDNCVPFLLMLPRCLEKE